MTGSRRMNREEFFAHVDSVSADGLRRALWTLYWRGTAAFRERIKEELQVARGAPRPTKKPPTVDPEFVADEVDEFCRLAYAGAYIGGSREVSPKERSRWRLTFRHLFQQLSRVIADGQLDAGAAPLEQLVDLACQMTDYDYFRSEDPIEAAKVVISDQVQLLWLASLKHEGFAKFAHRSAPQLIRWERPHGWTRTGYGETARREVTLASVLQEMLGSGDAWFEYADAYVRALDQLPCKPRDRKRSSISNRVEAPRERARRLRGWHELLLDSLFERERGDGLKPIRRIVAHRGLDGPDVRFIEARLAHLEGREEKARAALAVCLTEIPGDPGVADLAARLGVSSGEEGGAGGT